MNPPANDPSRAQSTLDGLLTTHRSHLEAIVRRRAYNLLRYESVDDLVQDISLRIVQGADGFEYRSQPEFEAFLSTVANRYLINRRKYWSARKRDAGKVLRLTDSVSNLSSPSRGVNPAASQAGPSTLADLRERLIIAVKAIELLLPRDQKIVRLVADGRTIQDIADRLEISYDAAERARLRAIERFEKVFELALRGGSGD